MNFSAVKSFFLFTLLAFALHAYGQPGKVPAPQKSDDFIHIRFSDEFTYKIVGLDTLKKLIGNVELNQDSVFLFCDSAIIVNSTAVTAKGRFILQHGKSTTIFADSALYRSDTKIAELYSNVSLLNGKQKLFTERLTYDANTKTATYLTGATLTDDTTFLVSVRGYFNTETDDIFFKDSVIVVNPDFTLRSDTLKYNASSQIVTFLAPTLITQGAARIYTEAGFYDIGSRQASFSKNPQYLKDDRRAWAKVMRYDGKLKEVTLLGDAHIEDSTSIATAELIIHNEDLEVTTLKGKAFIKDGDRTIRSEIVIYDARSKTYSTQGRTHIEDGSQILDAEQVNYDKERDISIVQGRVVWTDTVQNLTVRCEYAEHSQKRNYLKASGGSYGRPLMIKVVDGDSLYISADTLLSFENTEPGTLQPHDSLSSLAAPLQADSLMAPTLNAGEPPSSADPAPRDAVLPLFSLTDSLPPQTPVDSLLAEAPSTLPDSLQATSPVKSGDTGKDEPHRSILAYHDVRIFKKDLQAICDSLAYSTLDSMFRLYREPIIWSDTSQFSADSVQIQLANDRIDRIFLWQNSFIINTPDEVFFNQIKGKNSTAFFMEGALQRVGVSGNAESVYYALDEEGAYIGVNQAVCSEMMIEFGNNQVEGIRFYTEPKATLFPMKQANHEQLKIQGFNWQIEKRPNSVEDLLIPRQKEEKLQLSPGEPVAPSTPEKK